MSKIKQYVKGKKCCFPILFLFLLVITGCKIEGILTHDGTPLEGISVVLSGDASMSITTDANGVYSFEVPNQIGTYAITPTSDEYLFTPESRTVTINRNTPESGVTGVDFTAVIIDRIPPEISSTNPEAGATSISWDAILMVHFSEEMDPETISAQTILLYKGAEQIPGEVAYNDMVASFTPNETLYPSTGYMLTVKNSVKDLAGNNLLSDTSVQFTTQAGAWVVSEQKLVVDDDDIASFGSSVSVDGDQMLIGASGNNVYMGAAYIFERADNGMWTEAVRLPHSSGYVADAFGKCVSISGNQAVVSKTGYYASDYGAAYIYEKINGVWTKVMGLFPDSTQTDDFYGISAAVSSDLVVVGASHNNGAFTYCGAAYVYEKIDGMWQQTALLEASDSQLYHNFGCAVSISGGIIAVGAFGGTSPGVYIYEKSDGNWVETAKLTASDTSENQFGISVSISGDTLIAGARLDNDMASCSGSAYIFKKTAGIWSEVEKITPSDGVENGRFGQSVSIDGDKAVVGSARYSGSGDFYNGAAYLIQEINGAWYESATTTPVDVNVNSFFGEVVSLSGTTMASTARVIETVFVFEYEFIPVGN